MAETIGGRKFENIGESTARHDAFTMRQIAACGLNVIAQQAGEMEETFMHRLYLTALRTGDIFLLLGSLLVPESTKPTEWTEAMARDTAGFLGGVTEESDKARIRILLASALMPFFQRGRRSSTTSRRYSTQSPESDRRPPIENVAQQTAATGA